MYSLTPEVNFLTIRFLMQALKVGFFSPNGGVRRRWTKIGIWRRQDFPGVENSAALVDQIYTDQREDGFGLMDYNSRYYVVGLNRIKPGGPRCYLWAGSKNGNKHPEYFNCFP